MVRHRGDWTISRNLPNPDSTDPEERKRLDFPLCAATSLADAGELGRLVAHLSDVFDVAAPLFAPQLGVRRKETVRLLKRGNEKGVVYENPQFRFEIDFEPLPAAFGARAGQPRTLVYDYNTMDMNAKGRVEYQPATVDGAPVSRETLYRWLPRGSVVKDAELDLSTAKVSNFGTSLAAVAVKLWVQPAAAAEDAGEEPTPEMLAFLERKRAEQATKQEATGKQEASKEAAGEPEAAGALAATSLASLEAALNDLGD